ncbi:MAG: SDR family oxidoreductase [Candidatus Riflebacteria bacterium]|nr:SDR family oxidoreductase [Candidatus Riflebacteria bacterium]
MPELEGRVAIVTGGSGSIGSAICRVFVREGARVAFTYATAADRAEALVRELGPQVRAYQVSVTDAGEIETMARAVLAEWGTVDVLVNNAAIAQVLALPLIEEEDWDEVAAVNLKGPFLVTKAVVRSMVSRRQGSIVNIGSLAGERIMEVPPHYAATKAAMGGFTRSLAWELKRYNIRVNCVVPGLVDGGVGEHVPEKQRKQYEQYATVGRLGRPEEVAEVVSFVASSRAAFVNGQLIRVDGGI